MKKHEINPEISHWIMELQNFDYKVRMSHVDSLSRCNFVAVIEDNLFETNLVIAQNLDENIVKLRNELQLSESEWYEMRNGAIYCKNGEI